MLDPARPQSDGMKTIRQLREAGITIVSITHCGMEGGAAQADRVLVTSRGRIMMEGTPSRCSARRAAAATIWILPQAAELRDELIKLGIPMPENVDHAEACAGSCFKLLKRKAFPLGEGGRGPRLRPDEGRACRGHPALLAIAAKSPHQSVADSFPIGEAFRSKNIPHMPERHHTRAVSGGKRNHYVRDHSCRKFELHLQSGYAGRDQSAGRCFVHRGGRATSWASSAPRAAANRP